MVYIDITHVYRLVESLGDIDGIYIYRWDMLDDFIDSLMLEASRGPRLPVA